VSAMMDRRLQPSRPMVRSKKRFEVLTYAVRIADLIGGRHVAAKRLVGGYLNILLINDVNLTYIGSSMFRPHTTPGHSLE